MNQPKQQPPQPPSMWSVLRGAGWVQGFDIVMAGMLVFLILCFCYDILRVRPMAQPWNACEAESRGIIELVLLSMQLGVWAVALIFRCTYFVIRVLFTVQQLEFELNEKLKLR